MSDDAAYDASFVARCPRCGEEFPELVDAADRDMLVRVMVEAHEEAEKEDG